MSSMLYKRDTYLNKNIPSIFHTHIYEYDMHRAGLSISRELNLLPEDLLDRIERASSNKKDIQVILGKIQRSRKEFKWGLEEGFEEMRKRFFESNELEDEDILSIKKDAIFTFKECNNLVFGKVTFSLKHDYTAYIYTKLYEFYYNLECLDVKGMGDETLFLHKDYILEFINRVFYKMEQEGRESVLRYLRVFSDQYKRLELDPGYYREFNGNSSYYTKNRDTTYSDIAVMLLPEIDISFNYQNIILPMMKAVL